MSRNTTFPPELRQSRREELLDALSLTPQSALALSKALGLTQEEVLLHLQHLKKTLQARGRRLVITPPHCRKCQFIFSKRERLKRPGKCPVCRSSYLSEPMFSLD